MPKSVKPNEKTSASAEVFFGQNSVKVLFMSSSFYLDIEVGIYLSFAG